MSKYQPPPLSEADVADLWERAVDEMREPFDTYKKGCAYAELVRHAVDIPRLAADRGMEIQWAPMLTGIARIAPKGSKRLVTGMVGEGILGSFVVQEDDRG